MGIACPTTCGFGVGSEVSGVSSLAIVCIGGERGTVFSSILLVIEEAGVVGFVMFARGLPCSWLRFVYEWLWGVGVGMGNVACVC